MTIVDTSVWIDFLEGGDHWTKESLKKKIRDRESIAYIDMILLEIIQGFRERTDREKVEERFQKLIQLPQKRSTLMLAAEIYQELQKKGITIRSIIDCLIGAVAIETGAQVLHKDRDFTFMAQYYPVIIDEQ